jgi:hypothetical protein
VSLPLEKNTQPVFSPYNHQAYVGYHLGSLTENQVQWSQLLDLTQTRVYLETLLVLFYLS